MPNISIITPSYNQGDFIKNCLDSVQNQKVKCVEHIIIDNCSTDRTLELLDAYRNEPNGICLRILSEPDTGQTPAINKGFSMSSGEIVCWLNTDEFYNHGSLSLVLNYFHNHPEIDILFGDCTFVDSAKNLVNEKKEFSFNKNMLIYYGCYIPSCSTFIRRRVIDQGYLLDDSFKVCMDFEWYARLADADFKFAHIPANLANFTWHGANISRTFVDKRIKERHKIQLKYGKGFGSDRFKILCYDFVKFYYYSKRFTIRGLHKVFPKGRL